jgi:hypothetical protein
MKTKSQLGGAGQVARPFSRSDVGPAVFFTIFVKGAAFRRTARGGAKIPAGEPY